MHRNFFTPYLSKNFGPLPFQRLLALSNAYSLADWSKPRAMEELRPVKPQNYIRVDLRRLDHVLSAGVCTVPPSLRELTAYFLLKLKLNFGKDTQVARHHGRQRVFKGIALLEDLNDFLHFLFVSNCAFLLFKCLQHLCLELPALVQLRTDKLRVAGLLLKVAPG